MSRRPHTTAAIAAIGSVLLVACGASSGGASLSSDDAGATTATEPAIAPASTQAPKAHTPKLRKNGLPPGMIPYRGGTHPQVTPTCTSPKLTYFGGPIVQTPIIVPVSWSSAVNSQVQDNLPQFFADVTLSSYWTWLTEYDTVGVTPSGVTTGTSQVILPGTATAGVVLTPSKCAGTAACTVQDSDIQAELNAQIAAGHLPAPTLDCTGNSETIYMISFPPNVTVSAFNSDSCVEFCAYHNTGTYGTSTPLIYGVLMDEFTSTCSSGCGGNSTDLENTTSTASHELVEAVTDPDIGLDTASGYADPAGWGDNNNDCGEIADICDTDSVDPTITVSGRTWSVQDLWSNKTNLCQSTGTALPVCTATTTTNCRDCSCGDNGGACASPTTCGGGGTPTACGGCTAITSCPAGDNCGTISNGCGGTVTCGTGTCSSPSTCGGGGTPNVCGCTALTTCPTGDNCGTVANGCGGTVTCGTGTCASPDTCVANVCSCVALTTCPTGDDCGTVANGCGGDVSCGPACGSGLVCTANHCVSDVVDAGADSGEGDAGHDAGAKDSGAADSGSGTDASTGTDASAGTDSGGEDAGEDAQAEDSAAPSDDSGSPAPSDDSGSPTPGNDGGGTLGPVDSGSTASTDGAATTDDGGTASGPPGSSNGCSCDVVGSRSTPASLWSAIGLFAVVGGARLRRRPRRRQGAAS